jgi:hypothetical protein
MPGLHHFRMNQRLDRHKILLLEAPEEVCQYRRLLGLIGTDNNRAG